MARVESARMTHRYSGELVVFLIGMRINKPWRVDQWFPVFLAMTPMLTELFRDRDSGLLGYRFTLTGGGPLLVQYWSSQEKLYRYASEPQSTHRPAWSAFNRRARSAPGAVGIWHETYLVDRAETMYVGVPVSGLAKATEAVAVTRRSDRASDRSDAGRTQGAAPSAPPSGAPSGS
ncbi:hypothetical protein AS850_13720 [Frondihabitans sp. 762G35]|uniref:DUF4188 domain-containing protein n=1 Tax=Frondihabitans sp. 762G35 TaxID=1446794 RepID=UPI000D1FFCCB|nr:DUF4188 domain-containing protein [Frondihabitans sp. 762G35]ARC58137.1 hypothetical protein AS850_13720 [Frondihabitans sp. 762G35]